MKTNGFCALSGLFLLACATAFGDERLETVEAKVEAARTKEAPVVSSCAVVRGEGEAARYDQVPSGSLADFRMRLKLVQQILDRSGRAYDYRVLKQSELKQILSTLGSASGKSDARP